MSRRKLRPDELELWTRVARTTVPFPRSATHDPVSNPPDKLKSAVRTKSPKLPDFELGERAASRPPTLSQPRTTSDRLQSDPVRMDAKAFARMKRGKLSPEARIDLHGMTLDQAHPALTRFILSSQSRGLRLVLVITGKGRGEDVYDPVPRRRGVLKQQVPLWLRQAPVAQAVLQVSEAHLRHGGAGAYYVYLRRR